MRDFAFGQGAQDKSSHIHTKNQSCTVSNKGQRPSSRRASDDGHGYKIGYHFTGDSGDTIKRLHSIRFRQVYTYMESLTIETSITVILVIPWLMKNISIIEKKKNQSKNM